MSNLQATLCPNCGAALRQGAVYCAKCRTSLRYLQDPTIGVWTPKHSTLLYLFADNLVLRHLTGYGTAVPCRGSWVRTSTLADLLFAVTFWSLREQGVIALEPFQASSSIENTQFGSHSTLLVRVTQLKPARRSGLEGEIIRHLPAQGADSVSNIIHRWFGRNYDDPWAEVVKEAVQEAIALGCIDELKVRRGKLTRYVLGEYTLELVPNCAKIATFEGAFNDFAMRWQGFQAIEPELYQALLDECGQSIAWHMVDYD